LLPVQALSLTTNLSNRADTDSIRRLSDTDTRHKLQLPQRQRRNRRGDAPGDGRPPRSLASAVVQLWLRRYPRIQWPDLSMMAGATSALPRRSMQPRSIQDAWQFPSCSSSQFGG